MQELSSAYSQLSAMGVRPKLRGLLNVESGCAAVSTRVRDYCECVDDRLGSYGDACEECGASAETFIRVPSGDGDSVYTLAELVDSATESTVGAVLTFDRSYGLANFCVNAIGDETMPDLTYNQLVPFQNLELMRVTSLEPTSKLWFAEATAALNAKYAVVDLDVSPNQQFDVFVAAQRVPQDFEERLRELGEFMVRDPEGLRQSLLIGQGSLKYRVEQGHVQLEPHEFLPGFRIYALVVVERRLANQLGASTDEAIDWHKLKFQIMSDVVTSHSRPQHESTILQNVLFEREVSRAAESWSQEEDRLQMLLRLYSWLYQGTALGSQDCKDFLAKFRYQPSQEELKAMGEMRWQVFEAREPNPEAKPPLKPEASGGLSASLTKSSSSGLTKSSGCPNCGSDIGWAMKFCPNCGAGL